MDATGFSLRFRRRLPLLLVSIAVSLGCRSAENPSGDGDAAARGAEIADRMLDVYRQARSYTDHATYVQSFSYRGDGVQRELPFFEMSLAYEQPNLLRLRFDEALETADGTTRGFDVASDGVVMRASAVELPGQLLETKAPATINAANFLPDPLIRETLNNRAIGDVFPQLAMLLSEDEGAPVFPDDENPRLLDEQTLGDRRCYRVIASSPKGKRIFWIDANNYVLRRMELPIDADRRQYDPENQYASLAVWIDFKDPTFNAKIDEATFAKEPDEGDRLVKRLVPAPPAAPPERLGEAVGEFNFQTLDGRPITPAELKGKTVLLDFWQVNCAPCKAQTPDLEKVYERLKDNDNFAFYAVSLDPPTRVPNDLAERTLKNWGGQMPVLRDPDFSSAKLKVEGTPTLMLLDGEGRLQYFHLRQHRDPEQLVEVIRKVIDGVDLAAEARREHEELVKKYDADLEAAAGSGDLLQINVTRPDFGEQKLPSKLQASELWKANPDELARPGNLLILDELDGGSATASTRIIALDGGQAIVELDAAGKMIGRREIADSPATANGFLRTAVNQAGQRLIVASGVGWQKLFLFDDQWKQILTFPKDKNPGIGDVQIAALKPGAEPMLYVGYWGGVGVQGVALDGRRRWAIRSFDEVVQLAVGPAPATAAAERTLWGTSNRGTIFVLDDEGKAQPEIVVGLREIMYFAVRPESTGDDARCCGLAVEEVGKYSVVGFDADGEPRWHYKLAPGEYTHQVDRIQSVEIPGHGAGWMVAAPNGSIVWLDLQGRLIDEFRYGQPLTGLSLTNSPDGAILLVSAADSLTAWRLEDQTAREAEAEKAATTND
jgi:thiol-disulfide isomerase/thioredoxin